MGNRVLYGQKSVMVFGAWDYSTMCAQEIAVSNRFITFLPPILTGSPPISSFIGVVYLTPSTSFVRHSAVHMLFQPKKMGQIWRKARVLLTALCRVTHLSFHPSIASSRGHRVHRCSSNSFSVDVMSTAVEQHDSPSFIPVIASVLSHLTQRNKEVIFLRAKKFEQFCYVELINKQNVAGHFWSPSVHLCVSITDILLRFHYYRFFSSWKAAFWFGGTTKRRCILVAVLPEFQTSQPSFMHTQFFTLGQRFFLNNHMQVLSSVALIVGGVFFKTASVALCDPNLSLAKATDAAERPWRGGTRIASFYLLAVVVEECLGASNTLYRCNNRLTG